MSHETAEIKGKNNFKINLSSLTSHFNLMFMMNINQCIGLETVFRGLHGVKSSIFVSAFAVVLKKRKH